MNKIVFFNHYHRGDLHTHKEFVRQIKQELSGVKFEYLHNNPEKLLIDVGIETKGSPNHLDRKVPIFKQDDVMYVNTWVGSQWEVFCKHGGINMHTLYEQWGKLFKAINKYFGSDLQLKLNKEDYLPKIDYSHFQLYNINSYLDLVKDKKKILICNNIPNSNQSFMVDIDELITSVAQKNPDVEFICTDELHDDIENVKYTSHIIGNGDGCDLQEISYLSTRVNNIIGKNSGPFVFCETYDNYMDESKKFFSFNAKHPDYNEIKETMSNGLNIKCSYKTTPIADIISLDEKDKKNILSVLEEAVND